MSATKQAVWLVLTFIILTISGWYYVNLEVSLKLDNNTLATSIDTTVSNLKITQFSPKGILSNILTSPLMEHIPKDNVHLFKTPYIIIAQIDQPAWHIQAQKAKSFNNGQRIIFSNHVIVHQKSGNNTAESTLKTEEVTYYPKKMKATTELFVTFEQEGNVIQSQGMNAYLNEKRVELLHQARGSYAPVKIKS